MEGMSTFSIKYILFISFISDEIAKRCFFPTFSVILSCKEMYTIKDNLEMPINTNNMHVGEICFVVTRSHFVKTPTQPRLNPDSTLTQPRLNPDSTTTQPRNQPNLRLVFHENDSAHHHHPTTHTTTPPHTHHQPSLNLNNQYFNHWIRYDF